MGQPKVSDHVVGVLAVALGWGVVLFAYLWWRQGLSWWIGLSALLYALVHPVIGKFFYWLIDLLYLLALRLWQKEPRRPFSGVVEEMYVALFWPVIVPVVLPAVLVAISVGATFQPARRGD